MMVFEQGNQIKQPWAICISLMGKMRLLDMTSKCPVKLAGPESKLSFPGSPMVPGITLLKHTHVYILGVPPHLLPTTLLSHN